MTSSLPPPAAAPDAAPPASTEPPEDQRPRTPRAGKIVVVLALLLAVAGVVGANVHLPYVIFSPGDATPVDDYLRIKDARTYDHQGALLLLTVRVSNGRPNVWRFIQASLDDDSKVEGEDDYFGGTPRKRVDQEDVQAMTQSQAFARQAALTRLGYDVQVTGAGAFVDRVAAESPARAAGMRAGDLITSIDGAPIHTADDVGAVVRAKPVGTAFTVGVRRGSADSTIGVTSAAAPTGDIKGMPYFGIAAGTEGLRVKFPVDIKIDAGDVSGPSGGLAFALTIIDDLTPGNLTGGRKVAVTGTIDGDGRVGEVGGVAQKTVAARGAGATLMIVPKAEVKDARAKAGDIPVVGVSTLDEALAALHAHGGVAIPARPA
jgi:PDZ domain-containing protein